MGLEQLTTLMGWYYKYNDLQRCQEDLTFIVNFITSKSYFFVFVWTVLNKMLFLSQVRYKIYLLYSSFNCCCDMEILFLVRIIDPLLPFVRQFDNFFLLFLIN